MEVNDGESQLPIYVDELQHQNDLSINVYEIQHQNIDKGYDTINDVLVALKYKEPEGISWFDNIENLSVQIPSRIKLDIMKKTKSSNQLIEIDWDAVVDLDQETYLVYDNFFLKKYLWQGHDYDCLESRVPDYDTLLRLLKCPYFTDVHLSGDHRTYFVHRIGSSLYVPEEYLCSRMLEMKIPLNSAHLIKVYQSFISTYMDMELVKKHLSNNSTSNYNSDEELIKVLLIEYIGYKKDNSFKYDSMCVLKDITSDCSSKLNPHTYALELLRTLSTEIWARSIEFEIRRRRSEQFESLEHQRNLWIEFYESICHHDEIYISDDSDYGQMEFIKQYILYEKDRVLHRVNNILNISIKKEVPNYIQRGIVQGTYKLREVVEKPPRYYHELFKMRYISDIEDIPTIINAYQNFYKWCHSIKDYDASRLVQYLYIKNNVEKASQTQFQRSPSTEKRDMTRSFISLNLSDRHRNKGSDDEYYDRMVCIYR